MAFTSRDHSGPFLLEMDVSMSDGDAVQSNQVVIVAQVGAVASPNSWAVGPARDPIHIVTFERLRWARDRDHDLKAPDFVGVA